MDVTARQLNRATLSRQMLLRRQPVSVIEAVQQVMAIQAQEPASPYVALWNRVEGFDPNDLDQAFANHEIVKAPLMRITLHAVAAGEYTTFHQAMLANLRASRLNDRRFQETGLSIDDADALVPHVVAFSREVRSKDEVESLLEHHLGEPPSRHVWWALRTYSPLAHAPTGGPWSFGARPAYVAAPSQPSRRRAADSTQQLIWRYLEAFGPAKIQDVEQFAMLRRHQTGPALEALSDTLLQYRGEDGKTLYDVPLPGVPAEDTHAPARLLGMWDNVLLAYADRSRVIPEQYRKTVIRSNGDVLPTLLVDGYVAGVWRHVGDRIEARAFHPISDAAWSELSREAASLFELLKGRDESLYGRYARWWEKLPDGESRALVE